MPTWPELTTAQPRLVAPMHKVRGLTRTSLCVALSERHHHSACYSEPRADKLSTTLRNVG